MTTTIRTQRWKQLTVILLMAFAAIQFIRSYVIVDSPYLDNKSYETGSAPMPYQARILMAGVLKVADNSRPWNRIASHMRGPLEQPSTLAIAAIGLLSILIAAIVIHRWYLILSPQRRFPWIPFSLFLWMMYATYLARFQEAIYFPYDLLSLALFTLALFLCFTERYLFLAGLFAVACFNRETIVVILLPLAINAWLHWRETPRRYPVREIALALFFVTFWTAVQVHYFHRFAHNPTEVHNRVPENLSFLAHPQIWSQILSGAGFLLPVPFLWFRAMPSERMRLYSSLILVWTVAMFFLGLLPESRIFGELIGFLSVYCAIQFEASVFPAAGTSTA